MQKVNFAIVGYGGMGSYHARTLMPTESERLNITGVYDIDAARLEAAKSEGFETYESFEAILADEAVEGILIATPNDSHKELAITALRAGKHVLCEKPVAMNVEELDEILAVAKETGKTFMVHQNRRWDPDFLMVRNMYQQKPIGDIFQIESRVQGANGIPGDWRHLKEHGGGMLLDWGVHLLDQLLWLVESPIKSMNVDFSYVLGDPVDDGFFTYITFENGVRAIVEVGTSNYTKLPRWYVKGTEGTAKIDDWDLSGEMIRATNAEGVSAPTPIQAGVGLTKTMAPPSEEAMEKIAFPSSEADFIPFYQNVYEVIREGAEPIVKNEEVRVVLALIDDMFKQEAI
ncbi:Gfo/Idh/MocA family protein [Enterococcus alcedinis]|uniref:Oxidoreductase n=1 Tax=Enterococcus alcedinis TaxID=1274384 RepID=A0A917N4K3_9ENTE|nr:Gfo/Idh/MocA family oxidoreductase [Enterococcus alcedinis]MBP2102157.1 putative dehydrogenase [Enterococcus alcedinis]GGI65718.1 oxidoreductase [Enterococcus alcedinis]